MKSENTIQGTEEWIAAKVGKISASRICDVLAKPIKGAKEATTRRNYKADLVCERMTGNPTPDGFQSYDTRRGTELEPEARVEYELKNDVIARTAGFVLHPRYSFSGASPDGLINKDGMVQFKCVKPAIHLEWLQTKRVPTEHFPQMQWEMACTGRQWNDFVSYCPSFPDHLRLFIVRLERDDTYIAEVEQEVVRFNQEIDAIIHALPNGNGSTVGIEAEIKRADPFDEVIEGLTV